MMRDTSTFDPENANKSEIAGYLSQAIAKGELVLFIGNGIRRVPTDRLPTRDLDEYEPGPSWQKHMEDLWSLAGENTNRECLPLASFTQLPAPRQAEWFDDQVVSRFPRLTRESARLARLHLLGRELHPPNGIASNGLLKWIARVVALQVLARRPPPVHVVTTNVDCALEQNIAIALDEVMNDPTVAIETATPEGNKARWTRGSAAAASVKIWKIHGCLHAIKRTLGQGWSAERKELDNAFGTDSLWGRLGTNDEFAGAVPTNQLIPDLHWQIADVRHLQSVADAGVSTSVFSQTEYLEVLRRFLQEDASVAELLGVLRSSPLLFIGYDLHEVDVDVVAALQYRKHDLEVRNRRVALRYRQNARADLHEAERLRQLGVEWWSFSPGGIGRARLPGELAAVKRHEWRYQDGRRDPRLDLRAHLENPWRRSLQRASAQAWLNAQTAELSRIPLASAGGTWKTDLPALTTRSRLVVAGLASVWHAIALRKADDFPERRRASASLEPVDSQVPGGSGLVPVMVAATAAGPSSVGRIVFLSNGVERWSHWVEIEEFCLSAGVDVRPVGEPGGPEVGRTSHVLLFDSEKSDEESLQPRQRMILDVDEPVMAGPAASKVAALKVPPQSDFGGTSDLLFADKLADGRLIGSWKGPVVYETGSSGDELLRLSTPPAVWTASLGSFIRTLSLQSIGFLDVNNNPRMRDWPTLDDALKTFRADPCLQALTPPSAPSSSEYVIRINSFGQTLWASPKVAHGPEIAYGGWLQASWIDVYRHVWQILSTPGLVQQELLAPHTRLGGGFVATLHELGLIASWRYGTHGPPVAIIVRTERPHAQEVRFVGESNRSGTLAVVNEATIRIPSGPEPGDGILSCNGKSASFQVAAALKRHTLGAGDTLRGILSFGLWRSLDNALAPETILFASAVLASLKCYVGSFVDFLCVLERLRNEAVWQALWAERR
jgi:hypothetical protein